MSKLRGNATYLHEKLGLAISSAMFTESPEYIADVFHTLSKGISDVDDDEKNGEELPYLRDENARAWLNKIRELIAPSEADLNDPRAKTLGGWWVHAAAMTFDERRSLGDAMCELHGYLESFEE